MTIAKPAHQAGNVRIFPPARARSVLAGPSRRLRVHSLAVRIARRKARRGLNSPSTKPKRCWDCLQGFHCAVVPASDTGAYEMAMWAMLGARGVDALAWESFRRRLGDRSHQAIETQRHARAGGRTTATCRI